MTGRVIRSVVGRVAVAGLMLLSGCWLQVGADAGHTRFNGVESGLTRANVESLREAWSVEVPGDLSEPIVSGGRAFVTHVVPLQEVRVRAVDVATGATVWDQLLFEPPAHVQTSSLDGAPVAFVGDELWAGSVLMGTEPPGFSYCDYGSDILDPATGTRLGEYRGFYGGFPSAAVSSGTVVARTVVIASPSGCRDLANPLLEVSHRDADGSVTPVWRSVSFTAGAVTPTLAGDHVILAHGTGDTFAVDAFDVDGCGAPECAPVWTTTLAGATSLPVAGASGPVFVTSGDDLVALDRETGAEQWRAPLGGQGAGLALAGGTLYATARDEAGAGRLLAISADGCGEATCSAEWTATLGGSDVSSPTVGGGVVYVANGEEVQAFDAAGCGATTCSSLVSVAVASAGPLSLAQGRLFVAGPGRLTALAPEPDIR